MRAIIVIVFSLVAASSAAKRVEFECQVVELKFLSCELPSPRYKVGRNATIWFKNYTQSSLQEMTTVDFHNYKVSPHIPSRIGQTFPNLDNLVFRRSTVQHAVRRNFIHMRQLRKLNLSYNLIQRLPHDFIYDLPELEYLDLKANMISELSKEHLRNSPKLKTLYMESNALEVLEADTFEYNPLLEEISLGSNELVNIDVDFSLMNHVMAIGLNNNVDMCNFDMEIRESVREETRILFRNLFQAKVNEFCRNLFF